MSRLGREWEVKLEVLKAIAKSQDALARILDSVAEAADRGAVSAAVLREHIRVLTGMQGALLGAVTGVSWRPPRCGVPAKPWLAASAGFGSALARDERSDKGRAAAGSAQ
jgi:hypothetical protein